MGWFIFLVLPNFSTEKEKYLHTTKSFIDCKYFFLLGTENGVWADLKGHVFYANQFLSPKANSCEPVVAE